MRSYSCDRCGAVYPKPDKNGWKLVTVAIMSIHQDGFGASNHQERHICRPCAEYFDQWLKEGAGEKVVKKEEGATGGNR